MNSSSWPELNYESWKNTYDTLHRWTQIIGKIRMSKSPCVNHSWNSALLVTESGLTTSVIHDHPYSFSIELDFLSFELRIRRSDGLQADFSLLGHSVASFYNRCTSVLRDLGCPAFFSGRPNELSDDTPFTQDRLHRTFDPDSASRFWWILSESDQIMKEFRSRFVGKVSPVHFFWGGFDLAVSRFSGKRAPLHPGGIPHLPDRITQEAYSHEVSSCGFWPGNAVFPRAAFYSYGYPAPPGFETAKVPAGAFYHPVLREFILPLDEVRRSAGPTDLLLDFFQSTYEACANLSGWDRDLLENSPCLARLQREASGQQKLSHVGSGVSASFKKLSA